MVGVSERNRRKEKGEKELILKKLLSETARRKDRGVVCSIGDPQWGKTYTHTEWAREENREVIRLLVQTKEPESIVGYDVKHPVTGKLQFELASMYRKIKEGPKSKLWHIFIDELDKPREASLSSILTLICDRMIEDYTLPDTVSMSAAMNIPRAPLPEALVARLLFVPFPTTDDLTNQIIPSMGIFQSVAREYLKVPKVSFPERKKNAGTIHKLLAWSKCDEFWTDEALRHTVITGLVPVEDIAWWTDKMNPKLFTGVDLTKWAELARPSDVLNSLIDVLNSDQNQQKRYDVMKVLCDRANEEPTGEMAKVLEKLADRMHEVK